ncbi:MAG: hypothetical protein ACO3IN_06935 [Steroidobacteraceae bacterium]
MSLRVIEPLGVRDFDAADLPLKLGGAGADLLLPGAAAGSVAALVDLRDGQVVVEDPRTGRVQALMSGDQLEVGSAMLALRACPVSSSRTTPWTGPCRRKGRGPRRRKKRRRPSGFPFRYCPTSHRRLNASK